MKVTEKGLTTLTNSYGEILKKMYSRVQLKPYVKNNRGCILEENDENHIENGDGVMDEGNLDNPIRNAYECDENPPVVSKYWDMVPNEIVEKILLETIRS